MEYRFDALSNTFSDLNPEPIAYVSNNFIHFMNLLLTSSASLSTLWTYHLPVQHLYPLYEPIAYQFSTFIHSMNLLLTSSAPLFTLWTCCLPSSAPLSTLWTYCLPVQYLYPLYEPIAYQFSTFIHSMNLFLTSSSFLSTLWTCFLQAQCFYPCNSPWINACAVNTHPWMIQQTEAC